MDKKKDYILKNWKEYGIVDSQEDMLQLLNILEAHDENLDTFHEAESGFCGIYGDFTDDRDTAQTLFDFNVFYNNREEMETRMKEDAEDMGMSLEEYLQDEDIRETSDGLVRVLYY